MIRASLAFARLFSVLFAFALGGCASNILYNEPRDKQAQAAKKAASEVSLLPAMDALDKKYSALSQLEIKPA